MRAASTRSAPGGRGEVLLEMLPGERLGPGEGVEDGAMGGTAVGNDRHPAHAEQRSAPHLLVVDAPLHLLELGLHQQGGGGRYPARLDLALEQLAERPHRASAVLRSTLP